MDFEIETLPVGIGPFGIVGVAGDPCGLPTLKATPSLRLPFHRYHITPPVASDDTATLLEDSSVSGNVLSNDTDADGDPLTAVKLSDPTNGTLDFHADGSFHLYTSA